MKKKLTTSTMISPSSIKKAASMGGCSNTPPHNIDISRYSKVKKYPYCLQNDWLSITYDFLEFKSFNFASNDEAKLLLDELINIIYPGNILDDFDIEKSNKMGFQKRIILQEGIEMLFFGPTCANGNPTTMLNITGDGMRKLSDKQLYEIFRFSSNSFHLGKITRFDPGIDNYTSLCKIEDVLEKCELDLYKCKSKCVIYRSPNTNEGLTIYFGLHSLLTLRIYDKNAERIAKDPNFVKEHEYWTRFEFQCRDTEKNAMFASVFMTAFERGDMNIYARFISDCLAGFLTFYELEDLDNKIVWKEWAKLLENYSGIKMISHDKATCFLDTKIDWFNRSCMSTAAMVFAVYGETIFEKWLLRGIGLQLQNLDSDKLTTIRTKYEELGLFYDSNLKDQMFELGDYLTQKYEDLDGVLKAFVPKK